jgi:hypothetical protein
LCLINFVFEELFFFLFLAAEQSDDKRANIFPLVGSHDGGGNSLRSKEKKKRKFEILPFKLSQLAGRATCTAGIDVAD